MPLPSLRTTILLTAAGLTLTACDTYGYGGYGYDGYGYGYGNGGYGYGSGLSIGISTGPYWGWNDGFYYPGTGYYVYDSYRRPYPWNARQQAYWISRQSHWRDRGALRDNWDGFYRHRRR